MALLNANKNYIKIDSTGKVEVYKSKEVRDANKRATSQSIILDKYQQLIEQKYSILLEDYRKYCIQNNISLDDYSKLAHAGYEFPQELTEKIIEINQIMNEFRVYKDCLYTKKIANNFDFKYMKVYFVDILETIPDIQDTFILNFNSFLQNLKEPTVEDIYKYAKSLNMFGETEDC